MLLPLTGCATGNRPPTSASSPPSSPITTTSMNDHFAQLERKYDARLGVYGLATGTGATVTYRAGERFAFCSTFKTLAAAAVLAHHPVTYLDTVIHYTRDDIRSLSPITPQHVDTGMTIGQPCDAAIRYSD
ncbi:MAG: serine hydrolase, partial [Pseudonocardiaceae bacterium]